MTSAAYVPERGDFGILRSGNEWRSVLVLSPKAYNAKVGLALCCPIVAQTKGYPFEVVLTGPESPTRWVALADRVASMDWKERKLQYGGVMPEPFVAEALAKLKALLRETA